MDNVTVKIVAAVAIIVVIIGGISVYQNMSNTDSNDSSVGDTYDFTDSKGYEHSISVPISKVSVVHKYIPMFMKILGVQDEVAGLDSKYGATFQNYFKNSFLIGTYSTPDGAIMLSHGSNIILSPTTMGLSNSDALNELGIEIIYLDLTDPFAIEENLRILVNLFGATEEIESNYDKYIEIFKSCDEFIDKFDFSATADADICLYMSSSGFYQTHVSSAVKVIEDVSGKSYTHITDPGTTSTVYFNQSPTVIYDFDGKYELEYLFVYGLDTPAENYDAFLTSGKDLDLKDLSCVKNKSVYSISTDCVNGALSCVSKILYADAFGAEVGDKAAEIVDKINKTFGLEYSTENLVVEVV